MALQFRLFKAMSLRVYASYTHRSGHFGKRLDGMDYLM